MTYSGAIFLICCATIVLTVQLLRQAIARRGSGRLAQMRFKRLHGSDVGRALDGAPDANPHSPWIDVRIDGRTARLVAAPMKRGALQAGVELLEWRIPLQIWLASAHEPELELPAEYGRDQVLSIVAELAELGVENVASIDLAGGAPHVLRIAFIDAPDLADRLARAAPLLAALEQLEPA